MSTVNPKVSAYVPPALKTRLTQFREERNISESQAVIIILTEYFGFQQEINCSSDVVVGGVTLARIETLEQQMAELSALVRKLSERELPSSLLSKPLIATEDLENLEYGLESGIPTNDGLVLSDDALGESELLNGIDSSSLNNIPSEPVDFPPRQLTIYDQVSDADSPILEISPIAGIKLSKLRFGLSESMVAGMKRSKSVKDFTEWTKKSDPDRIAWKMVKSPVQGYVPADELPSELKSKLLKWMRENGLLN